MTQRLTRGIATTLAALFSVLLLTSLGNPAARADTPEDYYAKIADYYERNASFVWVDPDADYAMSAYEADDIDNELWLGDLGYDLFVAQVDPYNAKPRYENMTRQEALAYELSSYEGEDATFVVIIVTGDHVKSQAFGEFPDGFRDQLRAIDRTVNAESGNDGDVSGRVLDWMSHAADEANGDDPFGPSDEPSDEPSASPSASESSASPSPVNTPTPSAKVQTAEPMNPHADGNPWKVFGLIMIVVFVVLVIGVIVAIVHRRRH